MEIRLRPLKASIAVALLLGTAACASGATQAISKHTTVPVVRATEKQNGKTLTLKRGQRLQVVLHSTYWQIRGSTRASVLRAVGMPKVLAVNSGCVPGGGCGTVTANYIAVARGSAAVSAHRTTCGEALGCSKAEGTFVVNVLVKR